MHREFMLLMDKRVYVITLVLVAVFIMSFTFHDILLSKASVIGVSRESLEKSVEEKFSSLPGGSVFLLPLVIFVNNFIASIVTIASGFTVIGPLAIMAYNGIVTGLVVNTSLGAGRGFLNYSAFALLAPHGSLEIPTIALSGAIPIYRLLYRGRGISWINVLKLVSFILVTLAFVESIITPATAVIDAVITRMLESILV